MTHGPRNDGHRISSAIKVYALHRATFSLLFLALLLSGAAQELFATLHPVMYGLGTYLFAATSTAFILHALSRGFVLGDPAFFAHLLLDVATLGVLTAACGGLDSGFALPMMITVACAAVVLTSRLSLLLAAMASLTLLTQETSLGLRDADPNLFAAGLLGALLFAVAITVGKLSALLRDARRQQALQADETSRLEQLNERIIQRMRTGLIVVDRAGEIELINQAAVMLLGGHQRQRPLVPRQRLSVVPELHRLYQRWQIYPWLHPPVLRIAGNEVQSNFAPLEQDSGDRSLIFLEDNRAQAQRAQELKLASLGKLTAGIAHEIRNPLGAVSHAAQLLRESGAADAQTQRLAEIVVTHTSRINDIVENVLNLSRQHPAEGSRFELQAWVREFADDRKKLPSLDETIEIRTGSPTTIAFDTTHLRQVLTNLIDNALRHSERHHGRRWAGIHTGIDAVSGRPWLEVRDRGTGISSAAREHLFEPFFTTSHDGTGLGLYISRELCEMNHATLELDQTASETGNDGEGACFRIRFAHPDRLIEPKEK